MPTDAKTAAEQFMDALHHLEETNETDKIVSQFADEPELLAIVSKRTHTGREGAEAFWREYMKPFTKIHSEFTHVAADGRLAVLEWRGVGKLKATGGGQERDIGYEGCSLLEFDGGGRVKRFRTYYDSAAFLTVEPETK